MVSRRNLTRFWLLITAVLLSLLIAACDRGSPQTTFDAEGPVAQQQLNLFWLVFWIAVVVFIVVEGVLVYSIVKFRRKPNEQGLPPQIHGNTRLEITWTIVPIILLLIVAVPTFIVIADESAPPEDPRKVNVTVVAHQWWWEFQYPGLGVVTANELHIPIDRVIDITLTSQDVIHSFWVPKLAGKTDVVPANANKMWFISKQPERYYGQCAELCGLAHAQMRFRVISEPQEDFDAWVKAQKAPPVKPAGALAVKGQQTFGAKGCLVCHTVNGPDAEGVQAARMQGFYDGAALFPAPNLTTFSTRTTFAGGILPLNAENVRKWVANPEGVKPGNRMAQFAASYQGGQRPSPEDVDAIVAYLMSLKTDPYAPPATPVPGGTPAAGTPIPGATATPAGPAPGGPVEFRIGTRGGDLAFDKDGFAVKADADVTVTLANGGPKALQHNWVLVKKGTEDKVAGEGIAAGAANNWVPRNSPDVLAFVPLVDGGAAKSATFKAPAPGSYSFICSFPGHSGTMRGTFEVQA